MGQGDHLLLTGVPLLSHPHPLAHSNKMAGESCGDAGRRASIAVPATPFWDDSEAWGGGPWHKEGCSQPEALSSRL